MNEALFTATPGSAELLARRIQQSLRVILAGLEERVVLMPDETEDLRRDLGMLLHRERLQIGSAEVEKAEEILRYIVRSSFGDCLSLWFENQSRPTRRLGIGSA